MYGNVTMKPPYNYYMQKKFKKPEKDPGGHEKSFL
jgi:hypothetical protein